MNRAREDVVHPMARLLTKRWRRMKGLVLVLLSLLGSWVAAAYWLDRAGPSRSLRQSYAAIVVAGCRVLPNGHPSFALQRRVDLALSLHAEGLAGRIVFTGGVGTFPPSEAAAAADYARALGLPQEAIVLEERSTSTEENARFAAELLGDTPIIVVSDAYHTYRARRVFAQYFSEVDVAGSIGTQGARMKGSLREVGALLAFALRSSLHRRSP